MLGAGAAWPSGRRLGARVRPRSGPVRRAVVLFFFFQAEDGIRDLTVTGVQTCALPILDGVGAPEARNTDSAIASFRRANAIYGGEPSGFIYLGTLFANANQPDSSAK